MEVSWIAFETSGDGRQSLFLVNVEEYLLRELLPQEAPRRGAGLEPAPAPERSTFVGELAWCPVELGGNRWFAFVATAGGNRDVYAGCLEEPTLLVRITDDENADDQPAWSPDGGRLAFTSRRTGSGDIYVVEGMEELLPRIRGGTKDGSSSQPVLERLDGAKRLRKMTDDIRTEIYPAWTVDGRNLVYTVLGMTGDSTLSEIRAVGDRTKAGVRLGGSREKILRNVSPSPDGRMLAYYSAAGRQEDEPRNLVVADLEYANGELRVARERWTAERIPRFEDVGDRTHGGPVWGPEGNLLWVNNKKRSVVNEIRSDALRGQARPIVREYQFLPDIGRSSDYSIRDVAVVFDDVGNLSFRLAAQHGEQFGLYSDIRPIPPDTTRPRMITGLGVTLMRYGGDAEGRGRWGTTAFLRNPLVGRLSLLASLGGGNLEGSARDANAASWKFVSRLYLGSVMAEYLLLRTGPVDFSAAAGAGAAYVESLNDVTKGLKFFAPVGVSSLVQLTDSYAVIAGATMVFATGDLDGLRTKPYHRSDGILLLEVSVGKILP